MNDAWRPAVYEQFKDERALPFHELIGLVGPLSVPRAVDLGCGTGELTARAAERLGVAEMVGIDSSPAMLAEAAPRVQPPRLRFEAGDLAAWTSPADHGLVLANASLQWVPDHAAVLARWTGALAPGGQLAVQVPSNADHASHVMAAEVAEEPEFAGAFAGGIPPDQVAEHVLTPERYAELLFGLGFATQHVGLRVYPHVLDSSAAVVDWVRGTTLTRFRSRLPAELDDRFVARYRQRLIDVLGDRRPYLYLFKRILIWGRLPE